MNLMPFECKNRGKCEFMCDYVVYGHMPWCYIPVPTEMQTYDGKPISYAEVCKKYVEIREEQVRRKTERLIARENELEMLILKSTYELMDIKERLAIRRQFETSIKRQQ